MLLYLRKALAARGKDIYYFYELTLSVADSQHLLRVKVLNVINVLCVFYPLAPNAQ